MYETEKNELWHKRFSLDYYSDNFIAREVAAANFTLPNKREAPSILSLSTTIHSVEKLLKYVSFDFWIFRNFEVEKRQNHKAVKCEVRKW